LFAAQAEDLFFSQGFLHAQERLWQMELTRRFLSGRTAEIFGDLPLPWQDLSVQFRHRTSVDLDYFMRLLGIRAAAQASLSLIAGDLRAYLDSYSAGINCYIDRCGGRLPWEFRLLRHHPEPWRPEDTLTIGKGLALLLSTALYSRLNFFAVANRLKSEPAKLRALFPGNLPDQPAIARAVWDQTQSIWRFVNGTLAAADWHPAAGGSNCWAVASDRSQTGAPVLCNDPHLRMSLPSLWYLMHLKADQASSAAYEAWGATIPGCPLIQIGRNRAIAWGITAAVCDDVEIYRERVHRIDPERYLCGEEWRPFETEQESIGVRRSRPVQRLVRRTRHGPVISDFAQAQNPGEVLSVRWTAHEPSEEFRSLYGVNCASNWTEFLESLRQHGAPTLNFIYADRAGNIGYTLTGKIPRRAQVPTLQPLAGWDQKNDWRGYIAFEDLPRLFNPPEGWVGSANNKIADAEYPNYLSHFFEPPHRYRRIVELLQSRKRHSADDLARMQMDDLSLHARELVAALAPELEQVAAAHPEVAEIVSALLGWDGRCAVDSMAAAIFHVFHHRLLHNLLAPELGEEWVPAYLEILNQCIAPTDKILGDPESPWFTQRSRQELVALSVREAREELRETFGNNAQRWHWGKFHKLSLHHSLSRVPILRSLLSIGPLPAPGDGMTLNLGFYRHSTPYSQTVGASMRFVADMSDPEAAEFILASGQSGHPSSPHYADQTALWQKGRTLNIMGGTLSQNREPHELTLQPAAVSDESEQ
jgi:penicillin amidase